MNTRAIRSTLVSTLSVALALTSGSAWAISFRLTDLGTLAPGGGITTSRGTALNASGQVAGLTQVSGAFHAFLWDGTTMLDLGSLGGTGFSSASDINDAGQVVGNSTTPAPPGTIRNHAFLWDGSTLQDLGTLGGTRSEGIAINASGQVTGSSETSDGSTHAFLWDGTTMLDLGSLGGSFSQGLAINDLGQVTGYSDTTDVPFEAQHAVLWDGTTMQDLGTLGGMFSAGVAINASGQVTGHASTAGGETHAFLWDGTTLQDLGTLGGTLSFGVALNASGQVVGLSDTTDVPFEQTLPFLWDGTTMHDLNDLIHPADPLRPFVGLGEGIDINDAGQILANGCDSRTHECHAYLLSPIPDGVAEPGTLALLGLGLLGLAVVRRRAA